MHGNITESTELGLLSKPEFLAADTLRAGSQVEGREDESFKDGG